MFSIILNKSWMNLTFNFLTVLIGRGAKAKFWQKFSSLWYFVKNIIYTLEIHNNTSIPFPKSYTHRNHYTYPSCVFGIQYSQDLALRYSFLLEVWWTNNEEQCMANLMGPKLANLDEKMAHHLWLLYIRQLELPIVTKHARSMYLFCIK